MGILDNTSKGIKIAGAFALTLLIGIGSGYYFAPSSSKENTKIKISKETETRTIERLITSPDGTITKEREQIERILDEANLDKTKEVTYNKPRWHTAIVYKYDFDLDKADYAAIVQRRILGSIFIGIYGDTSKQYGASIGMEF